jgi:hypothetical protein
MSHFSFRPLLAAAIGLAALGSSMNTFAADKGCTTIALGIMRCDAHSDRTREAVIAETQNAQAAGQLKVVGELAGAPEGQPVPAVTVSKTRAQVKAELALARANHELPKPGDY